MKTPFNYETPNWKPLERALTLADLPTSECSNWMWMQEDPQGVHHFKHRDTRAYVRLTMDTSAPASARDLALAMGPTHFGGARSGRMQA